MHHVLVAHNAVTDLDDPSTRDVLAQVGFVTATLDTMGAPHRVLPVGDDGVDTTSVNGAGVVFNLVESPPGDPDSRSMRRPPSKRWG